MADQYISQQEGESEKPAAKIKTLPLKIDHSVLVDPSYLLIDNEVLVRKTFQESAQKGCELIYRLYYRMLCTHAVKYVYSREIAEDLVADVFYTFWNAQAYRSVTSSYRVYLFRSVRNRAYNYLANELHKDDAIEAASEREAPFSDSPEQIMRFEELYQHMGSLINGLAPQCRRIFIMNRFEGRKPKDIADELRISIRTVETHLLKASTMLKKGLKAVWFCIWVALLFP